MTTVAAIKMRYIPRPLWFDPQGDKYDQGDYVLVETERGREVGLVMQGALEASDAQIKKLKSPLKPVVRKLADIDFDHLDALDAKGREALPIFRKLIAKHELEIKAVQVEYLFSGDKAIFYFASEVRVDFRELVRELASRFHVRVDMRQIGARDEARMVGGLAHCGEELCCARLGCEFQPVSIRMAKEQDLPLNPAKISGACGRLMCCLRYEFEAYKEFKQRAPKKGSLVQTPLGTAKIVEFDTPREVIHLRLEDGKSLSIPLAQMDCEKDEKGCACNCRVSRETIDQCASPNIMLALSALDRESEKLEDSLYVAGSSAGGNARTKRRRRRGNDSEATSDGADARTARGRVPAAAVGGNASGKDADGTNPNNQSKGRNRRRRRSDAQAANIPGAHALGVNGSGAEAAAAGSQELSDFAGQRSHALQGEQQGAKPRPGQRSSGVRNPQRRAKTATGDGAQSRSGRRSKPDDSASGASTSPTHRQRRRRSS